MIAAEHSQAALIYDTAHHCDLSFVAVLLRGIFRERGNFRHKIAELNFPYVHSIERWKIRTIIERGV